MKNFALTIVLIVALFSNLMAGDHSVHVGMTASTFVDTKAKPLRGLTFGYAHEWALTENWALQTGIGHFTRGTRLEKKVIYTYGSKWATLNNINIKIGYVYTDVSIKWTLLDNPRLYIKAGVCPSLAIKDFSVTELLKRWNYWNYYPDKEFPPVEKDYDSSHEYGHLAIVYSSVMATKAGFGLQYKQTRLEAMIMYDSRGSLGPVGSIGPSHHKFISGLLTFHLIF